MSDNPDLKQKIESFDARIRELSIRGSNAAYNMYRGLEHEDLDTIEAESSAMWKEPSTLEIANGKNPPENLQRMVKIIELGVLSNKVDGVEEIFKAKNEAQKMLVEFKLEVDGEEISRTDIGELMRLDPDPAKRRRAAQAYGPLEIEIKEKVLNLISKRNKAAKDLGFDSYAHLSFHLNENDLDVTKKQLEDLLDSLKDEFQGILREFRDRPEVTQDGLLTSDIRYIFDNCLPNLPNDLFPRDKLIPALMEEYKSVGIDLDKLPIDTVIQDIPAGGFCFTVDPGKDMRILANPRDGQMWYQILFHEYGHAVQGSFINGEGYYIGAVSDPGFFWEGIAVFFEKLALRKSFLEKYISDSGTLADFSEGVRKRLIARMMRIGMGALYEYSIYLDPAPYEELQIRLADMTRNYYGVEPAVDPPTFTHDIFHITHPCYLQNYVLAEMVAFHLLGSVDGDPWENGIAQRVIDELLEPGGMIPWYEKIEKFAGRPLSPDALVNYLRGD